MNSNILLAGIVAIVIIAIIWNRTSSEQILISQYSSENKLLRQELLKKAESNIGVENEINNIPPYAKVYHHMSTDPKYQDFRDSRLQNIVTYAEDPSNELEIEPVGIESNLSKIHGESLERFDKQILEGEIYPRLLGMISDNKSCNTGGCHGASISSDRNLIRY